MIHLGQFPGGPLGGFQWHVGEKKRISLLTWGEGEVRHSLTPSYISVSQVPKTKPSWSSRSAFQSPPGLEDKVF